MAMGRSNDFVGSSGDGDGDDDDDDDKTSITKATGIALARCDQCPCFV